MRRASLLALGLSLALLGSPAAAQSEAAPPSLEPRVEPAASPSPAGAPDIVVVMVDDLGFLPREQVLERLPAIRELWLRGGVRFTEMHDESPLCGPSRANLLTGKHTLRHGMLRNDPRDLDDSETIAVALDEVGYDTLLIGKYLNHYDGSVVPPGWDHAFIGRTGSEAVFWDDGELVRLRGRDGDDVIRQEAVRSVRRAPKDAPLFALVSPSVPHVCDLGGRQCHIPEVMARDQGARACRSVKPFRPPTYTVRTNRREVREMPDWPRGWRLQEVCEAMRIVDRTVRGLVNAQAERGRDAYFIFLSDNGMAWGQRGFTLKHTPPSTRSPFLVAGPDLEPGETAALASKIDIAPTIAALAGTSLPWADGNDLAPLLRAPAGERAAMAGRTEQLEVMPPSSGYVGWNALRTAEWRFVRWDDGRRELYDLVADPWGSRDRVRREVEVAAQMEARLDEMLAASAGTPGASPAPSSAPMSPAPPGASPAPATASGQQG